MSEIFAHFSPEPSPQPPQQRLTGPVVAPQQPALEPKPSSAAFSTLGFRTNQLWTPNPNYQINNNPSNGEQQS